MVDRVDQGFLESREGEIPESLGFRLMWMLDHDFLEVIPGDEVDRLAQDDRQGAAKLLLLKAVATGTIRKPHDIDLGCRKEAVRCLVEEQQPDIFGKARLRRPADDAHAPAQGLGRKPCFQHEIAAHITKKLFDQPRREIIQRSCLVVAVIERHRGGQGQQFALVVSSGAYGAAVPANVVGPLRPSACQTDSCLVGARLAAWRPQHEDRPAVDVADARERMVVRLYGGLP